MRTYTITNGVPVGYDSRAPGAQYGCLADGTNLRIREYADLFGTSDLTIPPVITNLYNGAGLTVGPKFLGGTWHNYPNTSPTAVRRNVAGVRMDRLGFRLLKSQRSHDYYPNGNGSTRWHDQEPTNDVMNWSNTDAFVDDCLEQGIDPLLVFGYCPDWASSAAAPAGGSIYGGKSANPPDNQSDLADLITKAATKFAGRVKYVSFHNEPDNSLRWWNGTYAQYARCQRTARDAWRAVDDQVLFVQPGSASTGSAGRSWLSSMLTASDSQGGTGKDSIDIVDFHVYYSGSANYINFDSDLTAYKAILSANGLGAKELWCTEMGINGPHMNANGVPVGPPWTRITFLLRQIYSMALNGVARTFIYSVDTEFLSPFYFSGDPYRVRDVVEQHLDYLMAGSVTLVNRLADGRLAIVADGNRFLI